MHQENWPLLELLGLASSCLEACSSVPRDFKRFKQVQAASSTAWPGTQLLGVLEVLENGYIISEQWKIMRARNDLRYLT